MDDDNEIQFNYDCLSQEDKDKVDELAIKLQGKLNYFGRKQAMELLYKISRWMLLTETRTPEYRYVIGNAVDLRRE